MKKAICLFMLSIALNVPFVSHAANKSVVAYFTAAQNVINPSEGVDGNTGASILLPGDVGHVAGLIAKNTNSDLFPIKIKELYEKDYDSIVDRGGEEKRDSTNLTLIEDPELSGYETIYLGFPNWWAEAPRAVINFIEQNKIEFEGKRVAVFVCHGGGGAQHTIESIKKVLPEDVRLVEPYLVYSKDAADEARVSQWLNTF